MDTTTEDGIRDFMREWDLAMTGNDPVEIGRFMADDWVIVGTDGSVGGKAPFLALVASGDLSHDEMTTQAMDVRVYGDTAVTVARGTSGGQFRGTRFLLLERASCVLVRRDGQWRCVLTHLSPIPESAA